MTSWSCLCAYGVAEQAAWFYADVWFLAPRSGADKSVLNADGKTALEVAELNDQAEVAAVLAGKEE